MKNDLQKSKESLGRISTKICSEKYSCWSLSELLTAAGRPGRLTVNGRFPTVEKPVDRSGRPKSQPESKSLCRSTGPVDRGKTESTDIAPGRPGRSTVVHTCTAVHVGRLGRSTGLG